MTKINCVKCGNKFEPNGLSNLCGSCRRKKNSNIYKGIAYTILVIGFVFGIILGVKAHEYSEYSESGFLTMLYCWIVIGLFCLPIFAIHSICHRLDLLIDKDCSKSSNTK